MPHILVADKIADAGLDRLRAADDVTFDVRHGLSPSQLADAVAAYDGMLIRSAVKVTRDVLASPGRLAAIARAGVGVDNIDLHAATDAGILVLNTPDANTVSAAEHTIAMMLALFHRIPDAHCHVRAAEWRRSDFLGAQVAGRTLGIVGFGRIGRAVARRALGLDMSVMAFDPFVTGDTALGGAVRVTQDLRALLAAADCVTLHASLSDKTHHLIAAGEIAAMKPDARLVNCARGALVDEQALADALNSGRLAGAAVDVYEREPPAGSPLLTAKNVVLTPHLAASTQEAQRRVSVDAVDALLAYLIDGEIRSAVNIEGVPGKVSTRGRAMLDLCTRMGTMLSPWFADGVDRVTVTTHGDALHELGPTLGWQAMASVVGPHLHGRLNLVNARDQARRRGIEVHHVGHTVPPEGMDFISVSVRSRSETHHIEGTVFADGRPRILGIDGYRMEIVPERAVVLIFNDDRPGVIGLVGQRFADADINIADMALSRRGDTALMLLKLDTPMPGKLHDALRAARPPISSIHAVSLPAVPTIRQPTAARTGDAPARTP